MDSKKTKFFVSAQRIPLNYSLYDKSEKQTDADPPRLSTTQAIRKVQPVLTKRKKYHEQKRTFQYADLEEFKKKLTLIGITMLEYGPAQMRLLGYLLSNRVKGGKRKQRAGDNSGSSSDSASATASGSSSNSASGSSYSDTPGYSASRSASASASATSDNSSAPSRSSVADSLSVKMPIALREPSVATVAPSSTMKSPEIRGKKKTKKITPELIKQYFSEKNLLSQSNQKQQRDALVLFYLLRDLKIDKNCDQGSELIADLMQNKNKPTRYIFLFLKTIDNQQKVVGFISGHKKVDEDRCAEVDYVCPKITAELMESEDWNVSEEKRLSTFAAYAILKFLWFNQDKGEESYKYKKVYFKGTAYEDSERVFQELVHFPIGKLGQKIMGFKRSDLPSSSATPEEEE